ncbi:MAG: NADH-quinone oxidoreductase subunit NuoK [Alphaproteobacteria bacterium]
MTSSNYLILSSIIFSVGFLGIFVNRKNIISILMSIELMLLATNINFVGFSNTLNDLFGQIFALFVLVVAAAEAAIGLAILTIFFKKSGSISIDTINKLKG